MPHDPTEPDWEPAGEARDQPLRGRKSPRRLDFFAQRQWRDRRRECLKFWSGLASSVLTGLILVGPPPWMLDVIHRVARWVLPMVGP